MPRGTGKLERQYGRPDPLQVRMETHRRFEERAVDLDVECAALVRLAGTESLLDAGCGTGGFLTHLRGSGHAGRLVGLDQSAGMIAEVRASRVALGIVGDVSALPFRDGDVDWAVARHMLYHVPDIPASLRELDRVTSQGMVLSTGSADSLPFTNSLLSSVSAAFGFGAVPLVMERFSTENAHAVLDAAGLRSEEFLIDNALVFTSPEPIVEYVLSCLPSQDVPDDPKLMAEMRAWLTVEAGQGIDRAGGTLRDPKRVGLYRVMKE